MKIFKQLEAQSTFIAQSTLIHSPEKSKLLSIAPHTNFFIGMLVSTFIGNLAISTLRKTCLKHIESILDQSTGLFNSSYPQNLLTTPVAIYYHRWRRNSKTVSSEPHG